MNSFSAVLSKLDALPLNVSWQLESIAEKRGHQELYTRQSPEQLARLREYAMVESAVSSNRIEGIEVDGDRVGTIVFGSGHRMEMSGSQQGDDQVGVEGSSGLLRL